MRTIFFLVRKEFLQIFRDRTTVFQIFMIPVVQLLVLANAATFDVKRVAMLVVDEDRTTVSSGLVQRFQAGKQFRVVRYESTDADVDHALLDRRGDGGAAHSPPVRGGSRPARPGAGAAGPQRRGGGDGRHRAVLCQRDPRRATRRSWTARSRRAGARRPRVAPLDLRTQRWYNPTRNYKHWMVPALMVSLTTIIGLLLTAQNITRENELGTLEQLNVTPMTKVQFIAAKLIPFWILSMVIFSLGLAIGKLVFGIPMRGNLLLVYLAAAVYLIVVLGIGLGISTVTRTQQQAMFVAFFVMLIFLLMSGLFTPVDSMPDWAQRVAEANPVMHFVSIMRAVLMRGAGLETVGPPIVGLGVAGVVVLALAVLRYRKSVA